jgi:hypothetical protein
MYLKTTELKEEDPKKFGEKNPDDTKQVNSREG